MRAINDLGIRVRGRLRLLRGRCPACASEAARDCAVCAGYAGPYPPDEGARQRWGSRFEHERRSAPFAERSGSFVSAPILRSSSSR
jgi:hypothetical protein